jgi:hypothetical protein
MTGFALAAVIRSVRQVLAIFVVVVAIAGAGYLGIHKLGAPQNYAFGRCSYPQGVYHGPIPTCRPPTRLAWQLPVAVVVALGGLGAAVALGGSTERRLLRL